MLVGLYAAAKLLLLARAQVRLSLLLAKLGCVRRWMGAPPSLSSLLAGLAVVWDMLLTAHFMALGMITVWHTNIFLSALFYFVFATIDALYFSACVEKIPSGETAHCHKGCQRVQPTCFLSCTVWRTVSSAHMLPCIG